jgi:hypothetical protein
VNDASWPQLSPKQAEHKARDHELIKVAGLLQPAGLVDRTTGKPTRDRDERLGALLDRARTGTDAAKQAEWKRAGDVAPAQAEQKQAA